MARDAAYKMMMMRGTLVFIACTTATFAFVPHLKVAAKIRMSAVAGGDAPAVEVPKAKAVEAEAPKVAPSPAEDPFDQPKAEAKAAPAAAADAPPKKAPAKADEADAKSDAVAKPPATPAAKADEATADAADKLKPVPKKVPPKKAEAGDAPPPAMKADDGEKPTPVPKKAPPPAAKAEAGDAPAKKAPAVPKKAPIKAKEGGDAPAAMKPPAADGDAPAKKAVPKKAPPKKEEKHPYYAWANSPEAGYNTKAPAAYYKEKSQYDLGWFGKYDDSKTEAERSARFLARHDGVGGESYQTRTKERVYKEIAALKEERQARARRARERRGW